METSRGNVRTSPIQIAVRNKFILAMHSAATDRFRTGRCLWLLRFFANGEFKR
jgi:hypothetical protein